MFLHTENRELLWNTLQKSPYLVDFSNKFAGYREEWFRGIMETFYTQWISQNNRVPTNARELLETNKCALQFIVSDIKRLLGYSVTSLTPNPTSINNLPYSNIHVMASNNLPYSQSQGQSKVAATTDLPSYNVSEERQRREDQWSSNFNKYQSDYNRLLERPVVPVGELPSESIDAKITNIEELVKEHTRMRDMDLTIYEKPQTTSQPSTTKLKIMNELERVEMDIVSFDQQHNKSVHWSENLSESQ